MTTKNYQKIIKIGVAVLTVVFAIFSYFKYKGTGEVSDFGIFWLAAAKFWAQEPIYLPMIQTGFVYPPFAAMILQPLALMPLAVAAALYSFIINWGLWIYAFVLVYRILRILFPTANLYPALIFAFIASARFYYHNFIWLQVNIIVFCCTLAGLLFFLQNKFIRSYIFFLAGAFIKVTPVVFLIYAACKRGFKDWLRIFLLALPFIILPFLFRGFSLGIQDWVDYYRSFFAMFAEGYNDNHPMSQGLPAFLKKMTYGNADKNIPALFSMSENTLKIVTLITQLTVAALIVFKIVYDHIKSKEPPIGLHFCLMFMLTFLLPGRVWEHHHVPCAFVYAYMYVVLTQRKLILTRNIIATFCILIGLIGSDTVGSYFYNIAQHFTTITFLMIAICITLISIPSAERKEQPSG